MRHYPVFLDLQDRLVLVVGAGKVALRKTKGLLDAGARVSVVAPESLPEFDHLPLRLVRRRFRPADLDGVLLVFAAAAQSRGVLANIADSAGDCDFIVPARVQRGDVQIAISTGGKSPRVSAELRRKLDGILR